MEQHSAGQPLWKEDEATEARGNAALADSGHGCAEDGFEVMVYGGVLGDGGLDGALGDGARVAEIDESREGSSPA